MGRPGPEGMIPAVKSLGLISKWFLGLGMAAICWGAFLYARPAQSFVGESSRIVFFHVPQAWVSTLAFFVESLGTFATGYRLPALPR